MNNIFALINDNGTVDIDFTRAELDRRTKNINDSSDFGLIHDVISVDLLGKICEGDNKLSIITCNNRPIEVIANDEQLFLERFKINNKNTNDLRKYDTFYWIITNEINTK